MYVIVVYDTAAERNSTVLATCRQYLHHVQRSVFEGNLSPAQLLRFRRRIEAVIDHSHDHVLVYTLPPGADIVRESIGAGWAAPSDII
ncbi:MULTISPECIES: CRISPR-associated endonuclease Cas2 [Protofrankia]|uniref:CRISPR-associated endoribonuclease Cas2 n=1 Tax=Protofrankia coriariae TaxID=1562887 RepID=A0ABR5F442_9ACTN|nr:MULTISPECIES: CRISPR-associated endonuclease Cas2 [Protofrankia]KLL11492.1 CRISPR-associated protein Cas2 [Protofrankia coriariae]ONH34932.1 CRISPR-associated endonuclease Cas2 [Protofrankia sp. BMG5.30]